MSDDAIKDLNETVKSYMEPRPGLSFVPTKSDRDLAADYRTRMMAALDAVIAIINEANANGLQIGFNIGRDQYGRQRIDQLQIFRPL